MGHYVIQALLDGNIVYHRETPVRAGVENLINEGISQLFSVSGGNPGRDAVVEVLRYYDEDPVPEVELVIFADSVEEVFFEAEALTEAKGKVRTMSGKPHTPRKLKQDSGISPEEAARRIALKSETHVFDADTMEWDIDYLESYETPYGTKLDGVLYNPTTGESAEFEGITIETSIPDIDPMYANMEDIPTYEAENEDNLGPMFMAESKSTMPKIPKGIKTGGWQQAAYIYSNGDIFSIVDYEEVYDMPVYDIWHHSGNIPKIDAPKNTWIYDDEVESWDWDKILDKAKNQVNKEYYTLRAEEKKNCGCGQDPCKTYGAETFEAPKSKTLSQLKDTLTAKDRKAFDNQNWRYWDSPDSIWNEQHTYHQRITDRLKKNGFKKSGMSVETMIKKIPSAWTRFYNKWWAVGKSNFAYFGHPNHIGANIFNWSDLLDVEIWTKDNQIVMVWQFKHHDHGDASPWLEQTFTLPTKSKPKTAKKTTTRKAKPKAAKKLTAKTGRKAPTLSATKRKIGTRMRGNDGNMWQVKKSGKSQRWMAGAETQTQTFHSSIDSKFDELL
jgi:hypothetical protein